MTSTKKNYICDDNILYTREEVASMFQSFLDKYPNRKRTGTYKGLNYEIELINKKHKLNKAILERDYFAFVIYLTPELIEFYKNNNSNQIAIYNYKKENNIRHVGYYDIENSVISHTYNGYCDMPYHIHSMSVLYVYEDFQSLKTEGYVYDNITKWIDILLTVYENGKMA